jgi:hypothetical protein
MNIASLRKQREITLCGSNQGQPNKSFERTARQLAFHQPCMVSFGLSLSGGQPLNSSVRPLLAK